MNRKIKTMGTRELAKKLGLGKKIPSLPAPRVDRARHEWLGLHTSNTLSSAVEPR